jgi:hypothetical protein
MIDLDDLEAKARAAVLAIAEPDVSMTLVERDRAAYQFRLATTPGAVLELVERLRAAEAIVRSLADTDPVIREHFENDGVKSGRDHCALCVSDGGFGSDVYHEHECPWRRAVEMLKK